MAVPRAMARPLGPLMFALPVGGGGAGKEKTMLFDDETENAPSTSSSQPREWALVELQGEVQAPEGAGPEDSFTAGRLVLKVRGIEGERGRRRGKGEGGVFGCRWCPSCSVSKKRRAKKLNSQNSKNLNTAQRRRRAHRGQPLARRHVRRPQEAVCGLEEGRREERRRWRWWWKRRAR